MQFYRIAMWQEHFENNRTRDLKSLSWVPFPNKHDGDGYTELLDHHDGGLHFGAWCAIVQVASKCEPRGSLVRDGNRPHTAASISRMTKFPVAAIESAMARLLNIGWIEAVDEPQASAAIPQASAGLEPQDGAASHAGARAPGEPTGTEGNGREQKSKHRPGGVYARVTKETLEDTAALLAWIDSAEKSGALDGSQRDRISTVAVAERAIEKGNKPVALFVSIVKAKDWKLITQEQEDRARLRLKEFERERGPPSIGQILQATMPTNTSN